MKHRLHLFTSLLLIASLSIVAFIPGCDKKDDEATTAIPDNIFPLTAGNQISYSGYLTQNDTETELAGTGTGYSTTWTITTSIPVSAVFPNPPFQVSGNAVLVRDTTKVPAVGLTAGRFTPVFVRYDASTAKYSYMTNLGFFFRTFQVSGGDSLKFIVLADPRVGVGGKFTCYDSTFSGNVSGTPAPVNLKIEGEWIGKEQVTGGGVTYDTYYLVIRRVISVAGTNVAAGVTAKLWVAENIGPVQMLLVGDAESHGNFRVISGKNF